MAEPLFITQQKLEQWIDDGEVLFEDNTLTIFAQNVSYRLEPAIKILGLLDGKDDRGWIGKVVAIADVQSEGGEHLNDSVIVGDSAYQCEEGFVCQPGQQPVGASAAEPAAAPEQSKEESPVIESLDLLADFLLKHL